MTMDVSYIARNISLSESFRDHVVERTERLQRLAEGADTLEVRVTKESHHKHFGRGGPRGTDGPRPAGRRAG